MVRTLLAASLIALLSACNTFSAVDEYRPGDAGTDDSSGDDVAIRDGGGEQPECPEGNDSEVCAHEKKCGGGEYLICVCGTCPSANYAYIRIDLADELAMATGEAQIDENDDLVIDGDVIGTLADEVESGSVHVGDYKGFVSVDTHLIVLSHQTGRHQYYLIRTRDSHPQRDLAGLWRAGGLEEGIMSEYSSVFHRLEIDERGLGETGTLTADESRVTLRIGEKSWSGPMAWDRKIAFLTADEATGTGFLVLGRAVNRVPAQDLIGEWYTAVIWPAGDVQTGLGRVEIQANDHVDGTLGDTTLDGPFNPEPRDWEADLNLRGEGNSFRVWAQPGSNSLMMRGVDEPLFSIWSRVPDE